MNVLKPLTTLTLLLLAGLTYAQTNCTLMHSGSFSYANTEEAITVEVTATTITEQYNNGSVVLAISWQTECSYTATIQSVTVPDFPYQPTLFTYAKATVIDELRQARAIGDKMQVTINEVRSNEVHYTSSIDGESWLCSAEASRKQGWGIGEGVVLGYSK